MSEVERTRLIGNPDLPSLIQAHLTHEQLQEYLAEIEIRAGQLDLRVRGERSDDNGPHELSLSLPARVTAALEDNRSAQLRYHFDSSYWCDTLTRSEEGFVLLRIEHEQDGSNRESEDPHGTEPRVKGGRSCG